MSNALTRSLSPVRTMSFTAETAQTEAAKYLAGAIVTALQSGEVFLLLSGGSAIKMYQEMFSLLEGKSVPWSRLTASLLDERAVAFGNIDSNEEQLRLAGVLDTLAKHGAQWVSYLKRAQDGGDWAPIAAQISADFQTILDRHPFIMVTAGIGDDGHTSGLLPTQDQSTIQNVFEGQQLVMFYELPADTANPFRLRLTTTPQFIRQASSIVIYALGEKKLPAVQRFLAGQEAFATCPALTLRTTPNEAVLLTDQKIS